MDQQALESKIWSAADILRVTVDAASYKDYVFPLLFFKRINDLYAYEYQKALKIYDGDENKAHYPENFHFLIPENCHWDQVRSQTRTPGAALQQALGKIEEANEKLSGVFGSVDWSDQEIIPADALNKLFKLFSEIDLSPKNVSHDVLGGVYEYLLKQFAEGSGKKAGEFYTPRAVVHLMARLLAPQDDESIYDPTCGSAGILVEALNEVKERDGNTSSIQIYGQEVKRDTRNIAVMNLILHDIEDFEIKLGDTLRDPKFIDKGQLKQFDVVMANPPFSLDQWGHERWAADPYGRVLGGVPPKSHAEMAFLQHMIKSIKPESGRVGVVMPMGVLFRGSGEAKIRQYLIEHDLLETVIGLPSNLFYGTSIPACILICRQQKDKERQGKVVFVDASARFVKAKSRNEMSPEDIEAIVTARNTAEDPDGEGQGVHVAVVDNKELVDNEYDLNISRYASNVVEEQIDVDEALAAWNEAAAASQKAEEKMRKVLMEAGYETKR